MSTDVRQEAASGAVTSAPLGPTTRSRLRRVAKPLAVVVGVLLAVGVAVALQGGGSTGYFDPDAATPQGARALRVLLEDQGVTVHAVTSTSDAVAQATTGRTLLVADSGTLTTDQLEQLAAVGADLVVLDPDDRVVTRLAPGLVAGEIRPSDVRDPACELPEAVQAGSAVTGGLSVTATSDAQGAVLCYAVGGQALVARVVTGTAVSRTTTVIGSGTAFTNARLADEGDAALALNLLGSHPDLVWYVATTELPAGGGSDGAGDLLPPWVGIVALQLVFCVLLAALWRGRRLGPPVEEPLPADVPAAEATEGRARLYRRRRARDRAAQHLRAGVLARLRPVLGLPTAGGVEPQAVVAAAAARSGRPAADIAALLYGSAPPADAALVRLAGELDSLERQVRRP